MLRRTMLLSQDNQDSIIDREYLSIFFGKSVLDQETLIEQLEQVDKDEICRAASSLKLQAIYFYGRSRMTRVTFQEKYYPAVKETLYQAKLENGLTVSLLPKNDF